MEDDWEDTFEYTNNFPINFCPFCGEKIEISIAEKKIFQMYITDWREKENRFVKEL